MSGEPLGIGKGDDRESVEVSRSSSKEEIMECRSPPTKKRKKKNEHMPVETPIFGYGEGKKN